MDTGLLKAFIEVYRTKHFGRAAKNLFISQSAISARIRQLEDEVGARLFTRDRNNIELTFAGKHFLTYAENIINAWNRARHEIAIPEGVTTFLSVAALPSIWDIFLDDWLCWIHNNNKTIALQADVMRSDSLLRNLVEGSLDLGFVFDPPKTSHLIAVDVMPIPLIMVSSRAEVTAEEAIQEGYVFVDWGTSFAITHARQFPDLPPPHLRAGVGRIALSFLKNCGGSAYLPEAMVKGQLGHSLFRVDDAPVIQKNAYAVYSNNNSRQENIEKALSWFSAAG